MHELNVARELVRLVLERSKHPKKVFVELGALTTFKAEPLKYYFDILKKQEPALKDAQLSITEVAGKVRCNACKKTGDVEPSFVHVCPACSSFDTVIIQGKDFILKRIVEE